MFGLIFPDLTGQGTPTGKAGRRTGASPLARESLAQQAARPSQGSVAPSRLTLPPSQGRRRRNSVSGYLVPCDLWCCQTTSQAHNSSVPVSQDQFRMERAQMTESPSAVWPTRYAAVIPECGFALAFES